VKRRLTVVISLEWQNMLALLPSETHVEFYGELSGATKCLSVALSTFICVIGGMRRFALCATNSMHRGGVASAALRGVSVDVNKRRLNASIERSVEGMDGN